MAHINEPSGSAWSELRVGGAVLLAAYVSTFVVFFGRNGLLNAVVPVFGTDLLASRRFRLASCSAP
jgi:hypothetical protein